MRLIFGVGWLGVTQNSARFKSYMTPIRTVSDPPGSFNTLHRAHVRAAKLLLTVFLCMVDLIFEHYSWAPLAWAIPLRADMPGTERCARSGRQLKPSQQQTRGWLLLAPQLHEQLRRYALAILHAPTAHHTTVDSGSCVPPSTKSPCWKVSRSARAASAQSATISLC